jgi:hypothetical protein
MDCRSRGKVVIGLAGRFGHDYSRTAGRHGSRHDRPTLGTAHRRSGNIDRRLGGGVPQPVEIAIDGPAAAALQPLDDLTPLPWEVR